MNIRDHIKNHISSHVLCLIKSKLRSGRKGKGKVTQESEGEEGKEGKGY